MALIHNIIFQGLNCITRASIQRQKARGYIDFMAFYVLKSHHNTEETVYFPLLEELSTSKGVVAKDHAEHETFLPGLFSLDEYIGKVKADIKSHDGSELAKIVQGFGPALETPLQNKIVLLESLAKDYMIDLDLLGKPMAAHSKTVADRVCSSAFTQM